MADVADLIIQLIDKVSGPARKISGSLRSVNGAAKASSVSFNKAGRAVDSVTGRYVKLGRVIRGSNGVTGAIGSLAEPMGSVMSGLGSIVKGAALAATGIALIGAVGFAKSAGEAVLFRQDTLRALTLITKSTKTANDVFEDAIKLSDKLGSKATDTIQGVHALMAKGFSKSESFDLVKGMADLEAIAPGVNVKNLILAITQIKSAGKLQGDELNQLAEAGLNLSEFWKALSKSTGKTTDELRKMKEAGKLTSDMAIQGVKDSIKATTGMDLGKAAEQRSQGLAGMFDRLKNLPDRFFTELAKSASSSGAGDMIGDLFKRIGPDSEFFKMAVQGGTKALELIGSVLREVGPILDDFGAGFMSAWPDMAPAVKAAGDALLKMVKDPAVKEFAWQTGEKIAILIGALAGLVVVGAKVLSVLIQLSNLPAEIEAKLRSMAEGAGEWLGELVAKFDELPGKLLSIGATAATNLISGLKNGILGGIPSVNEAVNALGLGALSSMGKSIQAHSPSEAFAQYGRWSGEGYAGGMLETTGLVQSASSQMGQSALGGIGAGGGAGASFGNISVQVTVEGGSSSSAQELGAEFGSRLRRELAAIFDGMEPA